MSKTAIRPKYYDDHPSGIECIDIAQHMNFNIGNAVKYLWRAGMKTEDPTQDIKKAIQYLEFEIRRFENTPAGENRGWRFTDGVRVVEEFIAYCEENAPTRGTDMDIWYLLVSSQTIVTLKACILDIQNKLKNDL